MNSVNLPSVSIIIPAKNEETMLPRLFKSLIELNYPKNKIDVTVVDNGSTDGTQEIAKQANAKVLSIPEGTIAHMRNRGVAESNGDIVAFLDADMEVFPGWLLSAVKKLDEPGVGAVGGLLHIPKETTWVEKIWFKHVSLRPKNGRVAWLGSGNLIMTRELFVTVGCWDASLETCEDLDLCDRIKEEHVLYHLHTVAAIHHGGVRTLGELFKKELWRGKDASRRILKVWRSPRELQSFLFPILHGLSLAGFIIAVTINNSVWPFFLLGSLVFPTMRTVLAFATHRCISDVPKFFIVWFVYYSARAFAPFIRQRALQRKTVSKLMD